MADQVADRVDRIFRGLVKITVGVVDIPQHADIFFIGAVHQLYHITGIGKESVRFHKYVHTEGLCILRNLFYAGGDLRDVELSALLGTEIAENADVFNTHIMRGIRICLGEIEHVVEVVRVVHVACGGQACYSKPFVREERHSLRRVFGRELRNTRSVDHISHAADFNSVVTHVACCRNNI